jgi:hypothetical protein
MHPGACLGRRRFQVWGQSHRYRAQPPLVIVLPRELVRQHLSPHSRGLHEMTMYAQHDEVRNMMLDGCITRLRT